MHGRHTPHGEKTIGQQWAQMHGRHTPHDRGPIRNGLMGPWRAGPPRACWRASRGHRGPIMHSTFGLVARDGMPSTAHFDAPLARIAPLKDPAAPGGAGAVRPLPTLAHPSRVSCALGSPARDPSGRPRMAACANFGAPLSFSASTRAPPAHFGAPPAHPLSHAASAEVATRGPWHNLVHPSRATRARAPQP